MLLFGPPGTGQGVKKRPADRMSEIFALGKTMLAKVVGGWGDAVGDG